MVDIVPSNQAESFLAFSDRAAFDETAVYQASAGGRAFVVTECPDTDADLVLYVAGTYDLQNASPLVETAVEREEMYTHLKKLAGTHLATLEHDDAEQFFPDPDQIYAYDVNR